MGGELHFGTLGKDNPVKDDLEPTFYINNDSGRYGEYSDRTPEMLANVANRFKALGFPVEEQWLDKPKAALKNNPKAPAAGD